MTPNAPRHRNHETITRLERIERSKYEDKLQKILTSKTRLKDPPSQHIQAWHDHERATIFAEGHQPPPSKMGYHLWSDSACTLRDAHQLLTGEEALARLETGRSPKYHPRMAMQWVAQAIGFRYLRGLDTKDSEIQHITKGGQGWARQPDEPKQELKDRAVSEAPPPKPNCSTVFLCF